MAAELDRSSGHVAWCVGGFLFPVVIMGLGLAFERGHPPDEAELAAARIHPDLLESAIVVLFVGHIAAGLTAVWRWPSRGWVWVATAAQLACTLPASFLAAMAVTGRWL